jgi:phage shock protein PspC (stress-responsive transcriptional regulator)
MTTEQPIVPRVLRRRGDDRVLGGVASGLADYFNVDPLLIRIGFVGLMVFNGLGLGLYLLCWLFIPTDTDGRSVVQRILGDKGIGRVLAIFGLVLIGLIVLVNIPASTFVLTPGGAELSSGRLEFVLVALIAIVIGYAIFRRREPDAVIASGDAAATAAVVPPQPVVVRRAPRPASPLGWYVLGAMLVGIGLLALITGITGASVDPGRYFGLALAVIGAGLVIGTWIGHARLLILLGLLLLPFAFAASLISVPVEGGFGTDRSSPTSAAELSDEYRLVGGQIYLDLTRIEDTGEPIEIKASVALGELNVFLPDDAGLELDASVGGGQMRILGEYEEGTNLESRQVVDGDGPQFVLDLEAGLGTVQVWSPQMEFQQP